MNKPKIRNSNCKKCGRFSHCNNNYLICTARFTQLDEYYREKLNQIEFLISKLDTSMGCCYGDYNCDNCSSDGEYICDIKIQKLIQGVIENEK